MYIIVYTVKGRSINSLQCRLAAPHLYYIHRRDTREEKTSKSVWIWNSKHAENNLIKSARPNSAAASVYNISFLATAQYIPSIYSVDERASLHQQRHGARAVVAHLSEQFRIPPAEVKNLSLSLSRNLNGRLLEIYVTKSCGQARTRGLVITAY